MDDGGWEAKVARCLRNGASNRNIYSDDCFELVTCRSTEMCDVLMCYCAAAPWDETLVDQMCCE